MTSTLVDSNVLIDVFEKDSRWFPWSSRRLHDARVEGTLVLNVVIASEVARGFLDETAFDKALPTSMFVREEIPWTAAYRSGAAFSRYKQRGGVRERALPDFLIGTHALLNGYRLLTRDASRYRSYFPELDIIAPDTHP
jgi:hypothetical protein